MIKRLYIDNFRCLVNFELSPGPFCLLLGENGGGKTAITQVLNRLGDLIGGRVGVETAFERSSLTRWDTRFKQRVEIELEGNGGSYAYTIEVEHDIDRKLVRIANELLTYNTLPLAFFEEGEGHLFRDDYSEGPTFSADWSRSFLAGIPPRHDNKKLTWFREEMGRLTVIQPNPWVMTGRSEAEESTLKVGASNFASWYRFMSQEDPTGQFNLFGDLRDVFDGFEALRLEQYGPDVRLLRLVQEVSGETVVFTFDELSEGQRLLILLYALIHFRLKSGATLCLDEPDNFVALPEIQPWLIALREQVEQTDAQVFIVSHHPEIIDYLAVDSGFVVSRDSGGPTRVTPFKYDSEAGLDPSTIIRRGWDE